MAILYCVVLYFIFLILVRSVAVYTPYSMVQGIYVYCMALLPVCKTAKLLLYASVLWRIICVGRSTPYIYLQFV